MSGRSGGAEASGVGRLPPGRRDGCRCRAGRGQEAPRSAKRRTSGGHGRTAISSARAEVAFHLCFSGPDPLLPLLPLPVTPCPRPAAVATSIDRLGPSLKYWISVPAGRANARPTSPVATVAQSPDPPPPPGPEVSPGGRMGVQVRARGQGGPGPSGGDPLVDTVDLGPEQGQSCGHVESGIGGERILAVTANTAWPRIPPVSIPGSTRWTVVPTHSGWPSASAQ